MKNRILTSFIGFLLLTGFSALYAQSLARYEAAANEAERGIMEAMGGRSTGSGSAESATPVQSTRGGREPQWVTRPQTVYAQNQYIVWVGNGATRDYAEKSALAGLVSIFGISIEATNQIVEVYNETNVNDNTSFSLNTNTREVINTSASMNTLIGAEIGIVWDDGRGRIYALAFMSKEKTIAIYSQLIRLNQIKIDSLIAMTAAEKNSFQGYSRYKRAEAVAGINAEYGVIISICGGSTAGITFTRPETLSLEAKSIIENIAVGITVTGDSSNRIRDAFASVLAGEGLRTRGNNNPYVLEISISLSETSFPNNQNKFCRYTINADLKERRTNAVLLPFTYTDRAGHQTYAEAQNRAYLDMERLIASDYQEAFKEYLEGMAPQ
jgi:hypothetical protein